MVEKILCEEYKVVDLRDIKASIYLILKPKDDGNSFGVRLGRTRTKSSIASKLKGETVEIGSRTLPPKTNNDIKYVSYQGKVVYPVHINSNLD